MATPNLPPTLLIFGKKKEEITEEKTAGRPSKTKPPLAQDLDPPGSRPQLI